MIFSGARIVAPVRSGVPLDLYRGRLLADDIRRNSVGEDFLVSGITARDTRVGKSLAAL